MNRLKRWLFGTAPTRIEHPVFGQAVLIETPRGSYWEVETKVTGKTFTVTIETDRNPATQRRTGPLLRTPGLESGRGVCARAPAAGAGVRAVDPPAVSRPAGRARSSSLA